MIIEQAIFSRSEAGEIRLVGQSQGFAAWIEQGRRLCAGLGTPRSAARCPLALFVQPMGRKQVAIVRVSDEVEPAALRYHLLVLPRSLYNALRGDPFLIAERLPPVWESSGELPTLRWEGGEPAARSVDDVRRVLNVVAERTQLLLGGVQVLVDGGRLVFERKSPDPDLVRDYWTLLPDATRAEIWPTTFAYDNALRFHVAIVPDASGAEFGSYAREQELGDYPEGRYEYALQKAAEDSDQREIETLFARRSRNQMVRLAVALLAVFLLIPLVLSTGRPEEPELPPPSVFSALDEGERGRLAARLQDLSQKLEMKLPGGSSEESLRETVMELDRQLDARQAPPREAGERIAVGPVQRRLRVLLWKHRAADYDQPGLDPVALVDRLERALVGEELP